MTDLGTDESRSPRADPPDRSITARALVGIAGGIALATSFLSFSLWPVAWIAFPAIAVGIPKEGPTKRAFFVGWAIGLAGNIPAFSWLVGTIHRFGGFPFPIAVLFYGILSLYSALQFALFAVAFRRAGYGPFALFPPILWVALEFLYWNLFPWRFGHSQLEVPALMQIGEWTGPYGLSFVMTWLGAAIAQSIEHRRPALPALAAAGAAVAAVAMYGAIRLPEIERLVEAAPAVRIGIVQGNLSIEQKGNVQYFESNLATYRDLTRKLSGGVDVVIWPESVIEEPLPRNLEVLPERFVDALGISTPLLSGALTYEGDPATPRFYNTVVLIDRDGRVLGRSDKIILMPFGEFMPLGSLFPILYEISPMTGDFAAGARVEPLDAPGAGRFAPLNCYEDLVASIAREAIRTTGAEVLFAVANDAWFGDTANPYQHEALALWRAIENRRFFLRVTNTGVTDVIDPAGRVLLRLPVFESASATVAVKRLRVETFYTRYGDVFGWTIAGLAGAIVIGAIRRGRSVPANRPAPPDSSPAWPR